MTLVSNSSTNGSVLSTANASTAPGHITTGGFTSQVISTVLPTNNSYSNSTDTQQLWGCWLPFTDCWRLWTVLLASLLVVVAIIVISVCCARKWRQRTDDQKKKEEIDLANQSGAANSTCDDSDQDDYVMPQSQPARPEYEVLSQFTAQDTTQLSVRPGDIVKMLDDDADLCDWVFVEKYGHEGYVPGPFLRLRLFGRERQEDTTVSELLQPQADRKSDISKSIGVAYLVLYDFKPTDWEGVALHEGDTILVLEETAGWSRVLRENEECWLPTTYTQRMHVGEQQDVNLLCVGGQQQKLVNRLSSTRVVPVAANSYKPCAAVKPQLQAPPPPLPRAPIPTKSRRNIRGSLPAPPGEDSDELYTNTMTEVYQNESVKGRQS